MPEGGSLIIETKSISISSSCHFAPADVPPGSYVRLSASDTGLGRRAGSDCSGAHGASPLAHGACPAQQRSKRRLKRAPPPVSRVALQTQAIAAPPAKTGPSLAQEVPSNAISSPLPSAPAQYSQLLRKTTNQKSRKTQNGCHGRNHAQNHRSPERNILAAPRRASGLRKVSPYRS